MINLKKNLEEIIQLVHKFVIGEITPKDYEKFFIKKWRETNNMKFSPTIREIVDSLFYDCEDYCDDPKLFDKNEDITTSELRGRANEKLKRLVDLAENVNNQKLSN